MGVKTFQDENLRVSLEAEGDAYWVRLMDLKSGQEWPRVRLLAMEIYDRTVQRTERVEQYKVEQIESSSNGVHIVVSDSYRGISVGIWLRVSGGELSVYLSPAEIYESKPVLSKLFAVDLLPGMMRAEGRGELLLPINTGMVIRPGEKPAVEDRFLIYGEQSRWELLPTVPVCAVQTPAGGLVAIAVSGAAETECRVATDGKGGSVGLSFFLRDHDPAPIEQEAREIRFVPIPAGKDITVFSAQVLRQHIMRDLGKPLLKDRAKESPEVAHLLGAYIFKLFYGIQKQGMVFGEQNESAAPKFLVTMTFDEAKNALQSIKDAGIEKVYTQNVGWNFRGHDGAYPTRFPIEERVGGEQRFRDLIAFGHSIGYAMTVHDNYVDAYESSADFDKDVITVDPYGQMQLRGFWASGASYLCWPMAFKKKHLEEQMLRIKELGIRGPYYLDGMGPPLYVNYHHKHRGTRSDLARGIDKLLVAARGIFGSAATESGFLYCSITPDLVAHPGGDSLAKMSKAEWPITKLIDRCVPLWQMAMSGLVVTENQGIEWKDTMKALLLNQHPRYEWTTRPGVHPVLDKPMIRKLKFRYDLLIKRFGHLRLMQITDYRREGKFETSTFEDGTVVTADFGNEDLQVNGKRIEKME